MLCYFIHTFQAIPQLTAMNPLATAVPLLCIFIATGAKDAYDDWGRHTSDNRLNSQKAKYVDDSGVLRQTDWKDIEVGSVVKVEQNEAVAADIVLLSTSEASGLCFIETAELDGETNLKVRQPLVETSEMADNLSRLIEMRGDIICDAPNNQLEKFKGNLKWDKETYSLDNNNVVLRGCVIRNTAWVFGVVVYAGHDSKLMMNSGASVFKRTKLDKMTNIYVMMIALMLFFICVFCSAMSYSWEKSTGDGFQLFLKWETYYKDSPGLIALYHFPGFIMVLNTLIPISLYISVEVIRLGHSLMINWDIKMYHEETDSPAQARNTMLAEELGQIKYIFSDKTGTLTQNVMTFKECSINGKMFGHIDEDNVDGVDGVDGLNIEDIEEEDLNCVDFSNNYYADPEFKFYDQNLKDEADGGNPDVAEFFSLIAVCHTVMVEAVDGEEGVDSVDAANGNLLVPEFPDVKTKRHSTISGRSKSGPLIYQAQSPDEEALVSAARNFGFVFKRRTPNSVVVESRGKEQTYELLCILDFDNVRKRMSVIVKKDNRIILYCKGADTIIYELLSSKSAHIMDETQTHLDAFACNGLRTLCLASRELSEEEYGEWYEQFLEASTALEDRDEKLNQVFVKSFWDFIDIFCL